MTDQSPQVRTLAPKCNALKTDKSGDRCKLPAGYGTPHPGYGPCKKHLGNTQAVMKSANQKMLVGEAIKICEARGIDPNTVSPEQALLEELARSYRTVAYLESETTVDAAMWPDWMAALLSQRKHLAWVAKTVVDCGVQERQTQVMESQAEALGGAVRAILDRLELTEEQKALAPEVVRQELSALPAA